MFAIMIPIRWGMNLVANQLLKLNNFVQLPIPENAPAPITKLKKTMHEFPLTTISCALTTQVAIGVMHDLVRYGKLELTGKGVHDGDFIDNAHGIIGCVILYYSMKYSFPFMENEIYQLTSITLYLMARINISQSICI
jgi:hypothetical protein